MIDYEDDALQFLQSFKKDLDARPSSPAGSYQPAKVTSSGVTYQTNIRPQPVEQPVKRPDRRVRSCPTVSLQCDSVSASKSKCGFAEYVASTPPKYYLTKTGVASMSNSGTVTQCFGSETSSRSASLNATDTWTVDPITCATSCSASGSTSNTHTGGTATYACTGARSVCGLFAGHTHQTDCGGALLRDADWTQSDNITTMAGESVPRAECMAGSFVSDSKTATTHTITLDVDSLGSTGSGSYVATLSDEYDTGTLKSSTVSALPAYSGFGGAHSVPGQGTTCSATAVLATDETSYSIRKFKPRFNFSSAALAGMVLHYTERFTPTGGGGSTDTARSWVASGGEAHYDGPEVAVPSSNGTTTIIGYATDCSGVEGSALQIQT